MCYVLFDIGGTKSRVTISEDLKTFGEISKFKTPATCKEGVEHIAETVEQLSDRGIRAISGGIRGVLDSDRRELANDPGNKLPGWVDEPFAKLLEKKLKAPVHLENDTALAGLGEAVFGAGKDYEIVVYHTVSTGVGGVKIERGVIDDHRVGFEPGHQVLDIDRTVLGDDIEPTLENLVSGTALERRMNMKPYEIPQNDAVWNQLAEYLAHGLRNTILYWSPDVIVLGGSMILGDPRILLNDIVRHTSTLLDDEFTCPDIVDGKLGDDMGLYGAMAFLEGKV